MKASTCGVVRVWKHLIADSSILSPNMVEWNFRAEAASAPNTGTHDACVHCMALGVHILDVGHPCRPGMESWLSPLTTAHPAKLSLVIRRAHKDQNQSRLSRERAMEWRLQRR